MLLTNLNIFLSFSYFTLQTGPGFSPIIEVSSSTEFKASLNDVVDEFSDKEMKIPHPPKERTIKKSTTQIKVETSSRKNFLAPSSMSNECSKSAIRPHTSKQRANTRNEQKYSIGDKQDNIYQDKSLDILPSFRSSSQLQSIKALLREMYIKSREMIQLTDNFRSDEEKHKGRIMDDLLFTINYTDNPHHVKDAIFYLQER